MATATEVPADATATEVETTRDYFVGSNAMPMLAVAISVLATSQSAATFLGGPEYSYGKDLTFLGFYFSAFIAVIFVAYIFSTLTG